VGDCALSVEGSGHECDVKIETWLRDLLPRTPGAVRKVVRREFILACREFFERSHAWRTRIGPKNQREAKSRYVLSPLDAYSNVVAVHAVYLKGTPLRKFRIRPSTASDETGSPYGYWLESPDIVQLFPTPTVDESRVLTFEVALIPKQTVSHLPRIAQTHFYDALLDGALGRLYSHPAKPYSNPTLAQYHLQRFRAAIGSYAGLAKQGFAGAPSWSYPSFGK
jgi:hypothetical protein